MCAIESAPAIGTERLILRAQRLSDAERMATLANDFGVAANLSNMPHPYGVADAEAFIARSRDLDWNRDAHFAVEHRTEGLIGAIGLDGNGALGPELGYWLGRPYWGQGYATEAARAVLDWARDDWRRKLVTAGHHVGNRASGEVLCKAGFLYTGEVRSRPAMSRGGEAVPTRMMVWLA